MKGNSFRDVKIGAILSYLFVIANTIFGLVVTPYILFSLGEIEYGVYKTIASLSSSLTILDLGIGGMIARYVAKYKASKEEDRIEGFLSMALGEGIILVVIVAFVCFIVFLMVPFIYVKGLSTEQIIIAKQLFVVMAINLNANIIFHLLCGIVQGNNKYSVSNAIQLIKLILRIVSIVVLLSLFKKAIVICSIDLCLTVVATITVFIYISRKLNTRISVSFKGWDKSLFFESSKYTGLLFLTNIAAQVNNNLDNVVIGAQLGAASVTVYSIGLSIFGMFETLSTAISGVMLPTVTNILVDDSDGSKIKRLIIRVGRIQFMLLGSALAGFIVLGRRFVNLWVGSGFNDVYYIVLILIAPAMLELCVNTCLAILRAKNRLGFRTIVLMVSTIANAIITVVGVSFFGYYAAAVGTALSFLIGSVIIMNIYYYKKFDYNMLKIYKSIFGYTWICIVIAAVVTRLAERVLPDGWIPFFVCIFLYFVVFLPLMFAFGFNKDEKQEFFFSRRRRKHD